MGKASKKKIPKKNAPEIVPAANPLTDGVNTPSLKTKENHSEHKPIQLPEITFGIAGAQPRLGSLIFILLIPLVGFLAYSNTFHAPFQWDESSFIENNIIVKDLTYFLETSKAAGLETYSALKSRYIGYLTFALNYRVNGLDVTGYHIVNFTIHLLNTLLVYLFIVFTFKTDFLSRSPLSSHSKIVAFLSSMLFVSHPVQTEAVTYIFQRLASLVTMFYLLSLVCYIKQREESRGQSAGNLRHMLYALGSLLFAVLAMKTKENAFTLPFVIMLYEFSFFRSRTRDRIVHLAPILATLFIVPFSISGAGMNEGIIDWINAASRGYQEISRTEYLFTQFSVIVTYIRLLFLPINQNIDHDYQISGSFLDPGVLMSFFSLLSILGFSVYLFRKSRFQNPDLRVVSFGILWFFITLSIESSIIPIPMIICEYRLYLPSIGAFVAVMTGAFLIIGRLGNKRIQLFFMLLLLTIPLILAYASWARNSLWEDQVSLWEDVVKKSPDSARGHNNLGYIFQKRGMFDKAIEHYLIAIKLEPDSAGSYNNLGNAYRAKGLIDKAIGQYLAALRIEPDNAKAYNNLGAAYEDKNQLDMAIEYYRTAQRLKPHNSDINFNLGTAYYNKGLADQAIEHLKRALELSPDRADTHYSLSLAYKLKGLEDKAKEHYLSALKLRPDYSKAYRPH